MPSGTAGARVIIDADRRWRVRSAPSEEHAMDKQRWERLEERVTVDAEALAEIEG